MGRLKLNRRITFYSPALLDDGVGGAEDGWNEEQTVWSNIHYLRGGESVMAGRLAGKKPVIITVRKSSFSDQILSSWRVVLGGVDFNVRENPTPSQNCLYYEFLAESGVAVGV
ncbi:MAG: phage head closure protein [Gammaproteobacteria bacterium]|nr:phage head closure protein [Gammaproteobacteria bacterium]